LNVDRSNLTLNKCTIVVQKVPMIAEQFFCLPAAIILTALFSNEPSNGGGHSRSREEACTELETARKAAGSLATRPVPAPRRPVRVIHIEGTDLLIIIGQGSGRRPSYKAPAKPVTIEAIKELDLMILRSQTK
jgi:hypothetical protein